MDVVALKIAFDVPGIFPLDLHVAAEAVAHQVLLLGQQHVLRAAGQRVDGDVADHGAEPERGVDAAPQQHRLGAGHKLVVQRRKTLVRVVGLGGKELGAGVQDAAVVPVAQRGGQVVDLIEGDPVFDHPLVPAEQHLGKAEEQVDAAAVRPAVHLGHQLQRQFVVEQGDQRLDAMLFQLGKHIVIKAQAGLVWLGLQPGGKDARPVDRHAVDLEPHLGKQGDVLFIVVVKIHRVMAGVIIFLRVDVQCDAPRRLVVPRRHHVCGVRPLAVRQPGALHLVGRGGAAPQKVLREAFGRVHARPPFIAMKIILLFRSPGVISSVACSRRYCNTFHHFAQ